jgi:rRNA processing protein Krr1/Pno1
VVGQEGKTKFAIENATRTRIVIADQKNTYYGVIF